MINISFSRYMMIFNAFSFHKMNTSVAGGGGGGKEGGQLPPIMPFRSFAGYICKFVGTCKPTSMSFVQTKYLKYQQSIERYRSFIMLKCEQYLTSLARIFVFSQC